MEDHACVKKLRGWCIRNKEQETIRIERCIEHKIEDKLTNKLVSKCHNWTLHLVVNYLNFQINTFICFFSPVYYLQTLYTWGILPCLKYGLSIKFRFYVLMSNTFFLVNYSQLILK